MLIHCQQLLPFVVWSEAAAGTGNQGGTRLGDPLSVQLIHITEMGTWRLRLATWPHGKWGLLRDPWAPCAEVRAPASSLSGLCRPVLGYRLPYRRPLDSEAHPIPASGAAAEATRDVGGALLPTLLPAPRRTDGLQPDTLPHPSQPVSVHWIRPIACWVESSWERDKNMKPFRLWTSPGVRCPAGLVLENHVVETPLMTGFPSVGPLGVGLGVKAMESIVIRWWWDLEGAAGIRNTVHGKVVILPKVMCRPDAKGIETPPPGTGAQGPKAL